MLTQKPMQIGSNQVSYYKFESLSTNFLFNISWQDHVKKRGFTEEELHGNLFWYWIHEYLCGPFYSCVEKKLWQNNINAAN